MYQSPAVHVFSQENSTTVPKKPGATETSSRLPLQDRAVNPASPRGAPNQLKKPEVTPNTSSPAKENWEEHDDLFLYDSYPSKDFNGNQLDARFLTPKDTLDILHSYCGYRNLKTPSLELPFSDEVTLEMTKPELEDSGYLDQGVDYSFAELSIDDVPLPSFDFD